MAGQDFGKIARDPSERFNGNIVRDSEPLPGRHRRVTFHGHSWVRCLRLICDRGTVRAEEPVLADVACIALNAIRPAVGLFDPNHGANCAAPAHADVCFARDRADDRDIGRGVNKRPVIGAGRAGLESLIRRILCPAGLAMFATRGAGSRERSRTEAIARGKRSRPPSHGFI